MVAKPVQIRRKSGSLIMRILALFMGKWFLVGAWTTIGRRRTWGPDDMPPGVDGAWVIEDPDSPDRVRILTDGLSADDQTWILRNRYVVLHEICHTRQIRRWLALFHLTYLWFPLPVLLAWGRWRWEREAYLVNLRAGERTVDDVVDSLWRVYALTWPRAWMRKWFLRQLGDDR